MAVRAQEPKIANEIIESVAVNVVNLKRKGLASPDRGLSTLCTDVGNAYANEAATECYIRPFRPEYEQFVVSQLRNWQASRPVPYRQANA